MLFISSKAYIISAAEEDVWLCYIDGSIQSVAGHFDIFLARHRSKTKKEDSDFVIESSK